LGKGQSPIPRKLWNYFVWTWHTGNPAHFLRITRVIVGCDTRKLSSSAWYASPAWCICIPCYPPWPCLSLNWNQN